MIIRLARLVLFEFVWFDKYNTSISMKRDWKFTDEKLTMTEIALAVQSLLNNVLKDDNLNKMTFIDAFVWFTDTQNRFSSSQSFRFIWKRTKCLLINVRLFIENSQICRRFYKQKWTWDIQRISRSRKRTLRMRKNSTKRCRVKRKRCWWWVSTIRSLRIKTDRDLVFKIDKQRDDLRSLVRDYLNDWIKLLKLKYQLSKQ